MTSLPDDWTRRSSSQLWAAVLGRALIQNAVCGTATLALWQGLPSRFEYHVLRTPFAKWLQCYAKPIHALGHAAATVLMESLLWEATCRLAPSVLQGYLRPGGSVGRGYLLAQASVSLPVFVWASRHWPVSSHQVAAAGGGVTSSAASFAGMAARDMVHFTVDRILSFGQSFWRVRQTLAPSWSSYRACWGGETMMYGLRLVRSPLVALATRAGSLCGLPPPSSTVSAAPWVYLSLAWAAEDLDESDLATNLTTFLCTEDNSLRALLQDVSQRLQDPGDHTLMMRTAVAAVNRDVLELHPATAGMEIQRMSVANRAAAKTYAKCVAEAQGIHNGARLAAVRLLWALSIYEASLSRGINYDTFSRRPTDIGTTMQFTEDLPEMVPRSTSEMILASHEGRADDVTRPELLVEDSSHHCCSVCLEDYVDGASLRQLDCGHAFHDECIVEWLQTRNECPCCRARCTTSTDDTEIDLPHEVLLQRLHRCVQVGTVPCELTYARTFALVRYARRLPEGGAISSVLLDVMPTDRRDRTYYSGRVAEETMWTRCISWVLDRIGLLPLRAGVPHRGPWA